MASFPARLLLLVVSAFWALAPFLPEGAAAATYTVGDSTGWDVPSDTNFYAMWAANQTFAVGDSLVFNFAKDMHNVLRVGSMPNSSCGNVNLKGPALTKSPATVKLAEPGAHYYICTFPGHCGAGQMLSIDVTGQDAAGPTLAPFDVTAPPAADMPLGNANSSSPGTPGTPSMPATPNSGSPEARGPLALTILVAWLAAAYTLVLA